MPKVPCLRPGWLPSLLILLMLLPLTGCGGSDEEPAAAPGRGPHAQAGQAGSSERRPAQPPTPVAVTAASVGNIASYYNATATLEAEKEAEILARVTGVIETILCEEGDLVEEGQDLLSIDNDEYRLRLRQASSNTDNLRARHDRLQKMLAEELTSEEEYQAAKSELATADADEGMARLNVSYTTVTAPFSGKITQRLVDVGQNVSEGTSLFVIADFQPLLAKVYVPAKEFKKLRQNQAVQLVLDSGQERLAGRIKLVSPVIDPSSGTIKLTIEIPSYPPRTRPGDFAEVQIVTEHRTDSILVPKGAVISDKGEDVVFVAVDDLAERRTVEVGFVDDLHAEILSGLQSGELVVTKGQRSLKHGAPLNILEGGPDKVDPVTASGQGEDT